MKIFKPLLLLLLLLFFSNLSLNAQSSKPGTVAASPSPIQTIPLGGTHQYQNQVDTNFNVSISYHGQKLPIESPQSAEELIKKRNLLQQKNALPTTPQTKSSSATAPLQPVLENDFSANKMVVRTPPDNNIAIANNGNIVSIMHSSIHFTNEDGEELGEMFFSEFFSPLGLSNSQLGPKVIYDPIEDKFIVVVANGRSPSNSQILIAFSSSNNPLDEWYFYNVAGDPNGENWLHFPVIGISETELFISGNHFSESNAFTGNVIYQIEKDKGFVGEDLNFRSWLDIQTLDGGNAVTITPASDGFGNPDYPGLYFVSCNIGGGSRIHLYQITESIDNDPQLLVNAFDVPAYQVQNNGRQKGYDGFILTGAPRILSNFYADSTLFFTTSAAINNSNTGIFYGRIDLRNMSIATTFYAENGFECAYPSIAPFSLNPDDKTVLFAFLKSGETIYPEIRTIACNEDFEWSTSTLVRQGDSYVDLNDVVEYWGSYTGISRRYNASVPEIWVVGCYGNIKNLPSHYLYPWIGKLVRNDQEQTPLADFRADMTDAIPDQAISFADQSSYDPKTWQWSFPGGFPETSTERNPIVSYPESGAYTVRLVVSNNLGRDTLEKTAYINVRYLPVGDFEADRTLIASGEKIVFSDLSMNDPDTWSWAFPGGSPPFSNQQNPEVTYNNQGTFEVRLRVSNLAGSNEVIKTDYITVDDLMSNANLSSNLAALKIYPNPVTIKDRVAVEFDLKETVDLSFILFDQSGKQLKTLLRHRSKAGVNHLSFDVEMLPSGTYVLLLQDQQNKLVGSHKLVVVD